MGIIVHFVGGQRQHISKFASMEFTYDKFLSEDFEEQNSHRVTKSILNK